MIVGISGKLGSGKDTVASMLRYAIFKKNHPESKIVWTPELNMSRITDWRIKRFADKLKDMVCMMIGCTRETLEDREFKEKELGSEWWYFRGTSISGPPTLIPYLGNEEYATGEILSTFVLIKMTPRLLMQLLGTECGRQILHPNVWVNALMADYVHSGENIEDTYDMNYIKWLIPDTRFPNEAEAIKARKGILIRVERPRGAGLVTVPNFKPHPSETALDDYTDWDFQIANTGTLEDLLQKVESIVEKLEI